MRFSLRWLFGLVLYVAAGCALLASDYGSLGTLCHVAFAALALIALLGSIYTRHERRAFWVGCAIVAWSFMLTGSLPNNPHTPHGAIVALLFRLSWGHASGPLANLRGQEAPSFVAIGCSIAGGLLARRLSTRSAER